MTQEQERKQEGRQAVQQTNQSRRHPCLDAPFLLAMRRCDLGGPWRAEVDSCSLGDRPRPPVQVAIKSFSASSWLTRLATETKPLLRTPRRNIQRPAIAWNTIMAAFLRPNIRVSRLGKQRRVWSGTFIVRTSAAGQLHLRLLAPPAVPHRSACQTPRSRKRGVKLLSAYQPVRSTV